MNNIFTLIGSIILKDEATDKLSKVESSVKGVGNKFEEFGNGAEKIGNKVAGLGGKITAGVTVPVIGFGTAAAKVGIDFEAGMSKLQSISGATGTELKKLEDKARELGKATKYSATEASDAMTNLAQMGWTTEEIMVGVEDTLMLAAAGGVEMADAAMIMANTMNQYNLEATESQRISDILAFTAKSAGTDVYEMSEALKYAGANAASMGMSIEDTAAMIGVLGDAGITGSSAGTSLNAMLRDLKKNAEDGKIAVGDQTVALYNSKGEMRNVIDVVEEIITATEGMSDEQRNAAISSFLGEEALRAYNSIALQGKDSVRELATSIEGSKGAAKEMADIMGDNLAGKIDTMKASLEETGLVIYESLQPSLEKLVGFITDLSGKFQSLSPEVQAGIIKFVALSATLGPLLVIGGKMIVLIGQVASTLSKLGPIMKLVSNGFKIARTAMLAFTGPVGLVIAAVIGIIAAIVLLWKNWDSISKLLANSWDWIKEKFAEGWEAIKELFSMGWEWIKEKFAEGWENLKTAATEGWEKIKQAFVDGWEKVKEIFSNITEFFLNYHKKGLDFVVNFFKDIWEKVKEKFDDGLETVTEFMDNIKEKFNEGLENIKEFFSNFGTWIKDKVSSGLDFLVDLIPDKFSNIKETVSNIVEEMKSAIIDKFEFLKESLSNSLEFLKALFTLDFGKMKEIASKQMDATKEYLSKVWDRIKTIFSNATDKVKEIAKKGFDKVKENISKPIDKGKELIGTALDKIKDFFTTKPAEMLSSVKSKFTEIKDALWKPVDDAKTKIGETVDKIKSFFTGLKLEIPAIKLPKMPSPKISGSFSMNPPSVPKISWNAKGGIFDEPTIFNTSKGLQGVGEAGPEAIMPLDKLRGWIGEWMDVKNSNLEYISSKGLEATAKHLSKSKSDIQLKEERYEVVVNFNGDMIIDNEEREESVADKMKSELDSYFRSRGER